MADSPKEYNFDRVVRMALTAVTLAVVFALVRYLSDVLLPFAAAVVLAYLLNPIVTAFERRTHRRGLSVGLTVGGLFIVGSATIVVLVPLLISQISRFQNDLSILREDLSASTEMRSDSAEPNSARESENGTSVAKSTFGFTELRRGLSEFRHGEAGSRSDRLRALFREVEGTYVGDLLERGRSFVRSEDFNALLIETVKRLAMGGWSVVTFTLNLVLGLTGLIVVLLYLVFLLLDYPEYRKTWHTFLPPNYREPIVEFLQQFDIVLHRYLRGQSLVALLVAALFAVGFTIIGLPMAVPLALFVGLLNMVPYLQTVAIVPGVMLAGIRAIEGNSSMLVSVLLLFAVFVVVQTIQDTLITPRVMGKATGLKPVAILLGVFIWGKLLGLLGLILAIPLTCVGIAYYRRFVLLHGADATKITETDQP